MISLSFSQISRIAASVLVLIGGVWLFNLMRNDGKSVELATNNEILTDTIGPAKFVLDKQSKLLVHLDESTGAYEVTLEGRAFFEVNKQENERFEVRMDDLIVEDIGTIFSIDGTNPDTIRVDVREGEVHLSTAREKGISIRGGQSGYFVKSNQTFAIDSTLENNSSWADRSFDFNNVTLRKAIKKLNEVYEKPIVLDNDRIGTCRISVHFESEEITTIAEVIAETLGLQWKEERDRILISGDSCK